MSETIQQRWKRLNYDRHRELNERSRVKMKFGLTLEEYGARLALPCFICGGSRPEVKTVLDHDHATNKTRGTLCDPCNRALGFFRDDLDLLKKAVEYMEQHV